MKKIYMHIEAAYDESDFKNGIVLQEILYNMLSAFVRNAFGDGSPGGNPVELEYGVKRQPHPTELEVFIGRVEKDLEENGGWGIKEMCKEWREK